MILRPLAELAAATARETVNFLYDAMVKVAQEDTSEYRFVRMPEERIFIPCREGRSLYAFVKRRSFRKRQSIGRLSGHNNGKDIIYHDEL